MSGQLYVEAFGTLDQAANGGALLLEGGKEERFFGVFDALGELMGWSGHTDAERPLLWSCMRQS